MTRAAIALGSNLGDRRTHLLGALEAMTELGRLEAVSNLYETAPVGGPEQDDYLNAVAVLDTALGAEALLQALHEIEARHERRREVRWGPRTLDLDLLLYGREVIDTAQCTVPHPRLTERRFVVEPLLDAWPDVAMPDGKPVAEYRASVADQDLRDLGPFWTSVYPDGFAGRGGWWVVAQFILIAAVLVASSWRSPALPGGPPLEWLGGLLVLGGFTMALLGLLQLGDRLTPFPEPLEGGGVVHGGVYSLVRHPIYGGIVLGLVGVASFRGSVPALLLAAATAAFFWLKAGREEERLVRRFPHYEDYQRRTRRRLVPWLL